MITWIKNLFAKATRITELEAQLATRNFEDVYHRTFFDGMCDGEDAHEAGKSLLDNPNEERSLAWDAWRTGWIEEEYMKLQSTNEKT